MKYVFFDIECACVYKNVAKMCAFGYVVCDEKFNVLAREDILLNPKGKFHLTDRKGKEGLVLPYEYEDFKKYPVFPVEYPRIKALLEDKDAIVLGHATMNDVNYLNLETRRYKLPPLKFSFYDTQFFYMNVTGNYARQYGLGAMAEELGVEFTPHRAVDDAYATACVCKALCKKEKTDVHGLVSRYGIRAGRAGGGNITPPVSAGQRKYFAQREKEKQERAKAHEIFYRVVNKNMHKKRSGRLSGKVFCFAKEIEEDVPTSVNLLTAIFESGGTYTSHPAECNVYITREEEGTRYEAAVKGGAAVIPLSALAEALK
ncbi:MAG: 3'-5' exonuclease [Clostridia bacterium]|nr:3'-5' exonuclease [Clostridia bacterium]